MNLNDIRVITSTTELVPSTTYYPNGRISTHDDYTKSSINFGDNNKYNLIIDGINRTYIS